MQNHWAYFNLTWQKHPWLNRIQVYSNEGPDPFPRGDDNEKAIYINEILKSSYLETLGQFQLNLAQKIFREGDSNLFKLGFSRGDRNKIDKFH